MALTEKQQQRIARYVRDVNEHLGHLDEASRAQAERQVRRRIEEELNRYGSGVTRDEELEAVLKTLGTPARQAALHRPRGAAIPSWAPVREDRRWLGVCGGIARELQIEPIVVRAIVLVLGAVTLPFSLWVYLIAYGVMGFALQAPDGRERIEPFPIVKACLPLLVISLIIHLAVTYLISGVDWAMVSYTGSGQAALESRWTWYADTAFGIFFRAVLFVLPLAAMSALPVRADWQPTFRKLSQACVALYSVYAAYGFGTLLAGVSIQVASKYSGPTLAELARNFTLPF